MPDNQSETGSACRDREAGMSGRAERCVFLRGTGRCGTKSLVSQLGRHPDLRQVPFNEVLPEELIDWSELCLTPVLRQAPNAKDLLMAACRAYFSSFCEGLTEPGGVIVQKSTMRAHRLSDLLRYWPQARMIYLVRHPIGTVESLINSDIHVFKSGLGFKATVANSLLRWANDILAYLRSAAADNPRVLRVRFEDFITDPPQTMDRIYAHIGVRSIPYVAASKPERYDQRFVLNEQERRWIMESTRHLCEGLGYAFTESLLEVPAERRAALGMHSDRRLRSTPPSLDGVELVELALRNARRQGYARVGLFGAGYMARLTCPHLRDLPVEVVGLLDENPMLARRRQDGFTVYPLTEAPRLGIEAVIPLTLTHQETLAAKWRQLFGNRIPVVPLWNEEPPRCRAGTHELVSSPPAN